MRILLVRIALLALIQSGGSVGIATAQMQPPLGVEKTERADSFRLSWDSHPGKTYFIQQSNELGDWNYFPLVIPGLGGKDWLGVSSTSDKGFFRYIESGIPTHDILTADHDGDGVPSFAELTVTDTDPLKFSTAGNGLSDRLLFPNPTNGLYTDAANGIQYVILPSSPGSVAPPPIVATHYFSAPDYAIEFKKAEKSLEKHGYTPWVITPANSAKRYLSWYQSPGAADASYKRLASSVWQIGFTTNLGRDRLVWLASDNLRKSVRSPLTGVESIEIDNLSPLVIYNHFYAPWGWNQETWRGKWWSGNTNYMYDIPPYALYWDAPARPFFEERLADENTIENVGATLAANRPQYGGTWQEGNPWANWDHWPNELGVSYSRTKFRIRNKNGITDGEPAQVFVHFDPEGGEREKVMHVEWDGRGAYSPEYEIDPASLRPGMQGVFHINAGSIFFELDLAQAVGRKAGQTVIIPMAPGAAILGISAQPRSFSPATETSGLISGSVQFPGMDDTWYEGATITLDKISGEGTLAFKVVNSFTGQEADVPFGQNLAPDFFSSRGEYSSSVWIAKGIDVGTVTLRLTYKKGDTNLSVERTAVVAPSIEVSPSYAPMVGLARGKIKLGKLGNTQMPRLSVAQMPVIEIGGLIASDVTQDEIEPRTFYFTPPAMTTGGEKPIAVSSISLGGNTFTADSALRPTQSINYTEILEQGLAGISQSIIIVIEESLSVALVAKYAGSTNDEAFNLLTSKINDITNEEISRIKNHINGRPMTSEANFEFDKMEYECNSALSSAGYSIYGVEPSIPSVPVTSSSNPQLGDATFFRDARQWMSDNGRRSYKGKYKNYAHFIVVEANEFDMTTWTTTTVNQNIYSAIGANPKSSIVINGALFNYRNENFVTTGIVYSDGIKQSTSTDPSKASHAVANLRYWFGQTTDNSMSANGATAATFKFGGKGHPPSPAVPPGAHDVHSSTGGLISCIWPDAAGNGQKITTLQDSDLKAYAVMGKGAMLGYGMIGIDRSTGMMIILAKENGYTTRLGLFDVQDALWSSGVDQAVVTDGGSSVALALDGAVAVKGQRHYGSSGARDTVTNYLAFTPIPVAKLTAPVHGTAVKKGDTVTLTATAKGGTGKITKVEFFRGAEKVGEDTIAPYSVTYTENTIGTFTLHVKVSDSDGGSAESIKSSFTVNP